MKNLIRSIYTCTILLILAFAVSSCGGGGGGAATSAAPTTSKGKFIDAAVEGLSFTSGAESGETDASGLFSYEVGQPVTFSIGGIVIGTATGGAILTPVQLVASALNENDSTVINIVRFLITIDADQIIGNGIQITPDVRAAAVSAVNAGLKVNFNLSEADFFANSDVSSVVDSLTTAGIGNRTLVSSADAKDHLKASLLSLLKGSYSGSFSGDASGSWNLTIDELGNLNGSGSTIGGGTSIIIIGNITSSGLLATGSGWTGKIDIVTGKISGTWSVNDATGFYSGSLN